ncbi:hypothetical protein HMSSN036_10640 [Paenibacillus macerans]|nr:hypothetical protein HMSSN036_10640 [Paenibacillus macerans]
MSKFGLEAKVEEINRAAVRIAREAAGDVAYVAGAVGSIRGGSGRTSRRRSWEIIMSSKSPRS